MSIKVIKSDIPQPLANYSEASQANDLIFAAGQLASDFKTGVPAEARKHPNFPFYGSDIKLQTDYVLKNMAKTFKAAGTSLDNVVKAQVFLRISMTSMASTRSGSNISRCRRRARPSARPGFSSRTHWSKST